MNGKIRAAIYLRVGTDEQISNDPRFRKISSLMHERAESLGYEIVGEFYDTGTSPSDSQPILQALMAPYRKRDFHILLIPNIQTIGSDVHTANEVREQFLKAGIKVELAVGHFVTPTTHKQEIEKLQKLT